MTAIPVDGCLLKKRLLVQVSANVCEQIGTTWICHVGLNEEKHGQGLNRLSLLGVLVFNHLLDNMFNHRP